jgi:hypothetical protein
MKQFTTLLILAIVLHLVCLCASASSVRGSRRNDERRLVTPSSRKLVMESASKNPRGGVAGWEYYVSQQQPRVDTLASIDNLQFQGAFRLKNGEFGVSDINYAIGTLAYNPDRHSLFIVGHAHQNAVAEYAIIDTGTQSLVADLPETGVPLQNFVKVLDAVFNPEALDRITGMMVVDRVLYVNAETWYDAAANNKDTSLYVTNADNLAASQTNGFYEVTGGANSAGYMGAIPGEFQSLFGGAEYYTGWSSVHSITSRYSQGPSFWTFSPQDM